MLRLTDQGLTLRGGAPDRLTGRSDGCALGKAGPWVLALGLIRYAFVVASHFLDWLNAPLPESFRRKTVCVWQIVTLLVAVLPPVNALFASITLATALALLVWSFFLDIHWLYQRRHHHDVH